MIRATAAAFVAVLCIGSPARAELSTGGGIMGIAMFVDTRCPTMRPNYQALNLLMRQAGIDLQNPPKDLQMEAVLWASAVPASKNSEICKMVWSRFGDKGTEQPDVFLKK